MSGYRVSLVTASLLLQKLREINPFANTQKDTDGVHSEVSFKQVKI